MGTSSHKRRAKKTNLQKKIKRLQRERDDLKARLERCETEIEIKLQNFEHCERELQKTIHNLEFELSESSSAKVRNSVKKIGNWMTYGVFCSIAPLAINVSLSFIVAYDIKLSDYITDFLLVLFAISANLLSIISDERNHSILSRIIQLFVMMLLIISLELALILSNRKTTYETIPSQALLIKKIFWLSTICTILVIVLGIIIIIRQNKRHKRLK